LWANFPVEKTYASEERRLRLQQSLGQAKGHDLILGLLFSTAAVGILLSVKSQPILFHLAKTVLLPLAQNHGFSGLSSKWYWF